MIQGKIFAATGTINRWTHRFLPAGSITRSVALLVGGSAIGQVISMAAMPILTRIYTPTDFGLMGVFNSLLALVVVLATARFETVLPLPKTDEEAIDVLWLCVFVLLGMVGLTTVAIAFWSAPILNLVNASRIAPYAFLLPLGVAGAGLYNVLNYWAVRRKAYKRIAQTRLSQSLSNVAVGVAVGLVWPGPLGLLLAVLAIQTSGIVSLSREVHAATGGLLPRPSLRRMAAAAYTYRQFPLFASGAILLCTLAMTAPNFLLTKFYSAEVTGWFNLAQRVVALPMALLGTAIAQIFTGEAAELMRSRPGELPALFRRASLRLSKLSLLVVAIGLAGPFVFGLAFGAKWSEAGYYALFLAICGAGQIIVSPISSIATIVQRMDVQLMLDCLRLLLVSISLYLPYHFHSSGWVAVLSYSIATAIAYGVSYLVYLRLLHSFVRRHAAL